MANIDSINAFIDGREDFGYLANSIFVKDGIIYSYGPHWPIGVRSTVGSIMVNKDKRSTTSTKHVNELIAELSKRDIPYYMHTLDDLQAQIEVNRRDQAT